MGRKKYRKKDQAIISAVQLDLDCDGFGYRKWGDVQRCKKGDWLVNNDGECYTIDGNIFAETYERIGLGQYKKTAVVWAELAEEYLVFSEEFGKKSYKVSKQRFESMYERVT